jgi:dolichyl-phosphate-mannose--protein O-mannosyl transferase
LEADRRGEVNAGWFATTPRHCILWGALIFAVSLAAFLWGIDSAGELYFDEAWYVPAARAWLQSGEMLHQEHPPLGKLLIALSLWLFGDNPFGWRAMSALFGSIALVAVFLWTLALLDDLRAALWSAAVTFFNAILFVQARIAMLDIFLMAFISLALAFYTLSNKESRTARRSLVYALAMGVCLGLAAACKWSGFFLLFGLLAIQLLIGLMRLWRVNFEDPRPSDFYAPGASRAWTSLNTLVAFAVAPLSAYFLAYAPQMIRAGSIFEFAASHQRMFEIWSGHSTNHPYESLWYTWPFLWRPVWYLFEIKGRDAALWSAQNPAKAIAGLANPIVVFAGEIAILIALFRFVARRERNSLIVAVAFFSQYLPWAINPKGLEFSYYFFPSVMCLGPALALIFFREGSVRGARAALAFLALAGLAFVFFLPILAAGIGVAPEGFALRMWLPSWR